MSDDSAESGSLDDETDTLTESVTLAQPSSTYKVLGEFTDDTGAGVLGHNKATSGTAIGVQGATDSGAGYGLHTPDDTYVGGVAELGGLAGSVTGNTEISNLLGESLTIDGSNTLQVTSIYKTNIFDTSGISWDPVTGLASKTAVEILLDTKEMNTGRIAVDVDGSSKLSTTVKEVRNRVVGASSSVTISSQLDFGLDTDYTPSKQDPSGVTFKSDGTKMYIADDGYATVDEFSLSSAWDVSTASSSNATLDASSQDTTLRGFTFKDDGTKIYLSGQDNGKVYSYSLSSAWDLSNTTYLESFSPTNFPRDVAFNSDGTKLFVVGGGSSDAYVHPLNSGWDLGTAQSGTRYVFSDPDPTTGIGFSGDGTELYLTDTTGDYVYWYALSTGWDLSTRSFLHRSDISSDVFETSDLFVRGDGSFAAIVDTSDLYIHQFSKKFDGEAYATVEKEHP